MNEIVYVSRHSLETLNVARHLHNTWELIYYTTGSGTMVFDDMTIRYQDGDIIAIPPNIPHTNLSETGFTNIFLNIKDSNITFRTPVRIQDDACHNLLNVFNAIYYHYNEENSNDNLLNAYGHLLASYIHAYQQAPVRSDIVEEIRSNIVQNFSDCHYELEVFLRSLPFSYDYLRKLFKKEMGITPHQYLCNKRLDTAADWLSSVYNDSGNIADVARLCGFSEPLYFSRMFKKRFGVAPSFFRNSHQQAVERLEPNEVKVPDLNSEDA